MLNALVIAYQTAKAAEEAAKANRIEVEAALIKAVSNPLAEGTTSVKTPKYKVSVANKLTRSLDHDAYLDIVDSLPESLHFVDYKPTINLKPLRHLEAVDPDLAAKCVTVKPARPTITIKEVE